MNKTVVFRCDASPALGMGHVVRCRALAKALAAEGWRVRFAMASGGEHVPDFQVTGPRWGACDALVVDVRDAVSPEQLAAARAKGTLVVVLDDASDRRLAADLVFYPPVPQVGRLEWPGFEGESFSGWEWVILREEFGTPLPRVKNDPPVVLISMGGSDPLGLTERVLAALDPAEIGCVVKVVTGPGYLEAHGGALPDFPDGSVHLASPPNLPELMASADLAVVSFGMTAYELAACGTPGIYLGISDDHAESASAFQEAGLGINLGNFMSAGDVDIREAVAALASNAPRRADMGVQGQRLVDGKGAERIARVITDWTRGT